jgi:homocysteine S-methyltransferase
MSLADLFEPAPLLADGAMGTLLHSRGHATDSVLERLNLTRPAEIRAIHAAYVDAGVDLLCTNTFAANRLRLGAALEGGDDLRRINEAGARLAREAADQAGRRVLVAGDVGPTGGRLAPYGRLRPAAARAIFSEQVEALGQGGVDLVLCETFADVRELLEAVAAVRDAGGLPVVATMTFTRDDRTLLGESPAQVAARLAEAGADLIGVNCAGGPAQALRLVRAMQRAVPLARLAVKPNAGWPEQIGGRLAYPATPAYFADYARQFAEEGVVLIGGCCGTTPEHTAAMRAALDECSSGAVSASAGAGPSVGSTRAADSRGGRRQVGVPDAGESRRLADRLRAGEFVVTVEMSPPKGLNTQALLAGAQLLREAGAAAINVADSPRARMRMSPWALCHLIRAEVGLDTVLHFPLRGRNVLRVQGDLLAAHALGIRNLFAVMGDPTAIGDHPGAMDAFDLVPSGLIRLVKQGLNTGVDLAGSGLDEPTSFFVGCALNFAAGDADKEFRSLRKKLDAGADFVLTQPVYDPAGARAFLRHHEERHGPLGVPLIAGVLPLWGERHASFLHNEVPGISIPEPLRARVARGGRDEGRRIAVEIATELRVFAQGVYLMPPFARWDMAAEIIEAL